MDNLRASTALLTSNVLVCLALILLRHSAADASVRSFYLLAANGIAGLLGFLPLRKENELKLDRSFLAVALWSACYCAEYGIFLVYPQLISLSQLIVCNSLAPLAAVYLVAGWKEDTPSRMDQRSLPSLPSCSCLVSHIWRESRTPPPASLPGQSFLSCSSLSSVRNHALAMWREQSLQPGVNPALHL